MPILKDHPSGLSGAGFALSSSWSGNAPNASQLHARLLGVDFSYNPARDMGSARFHIGSGPVFSGGSPHARKCLLGDQNYARRNGKDRRLAAMGGGLVPAGCPPPSCVPPSPYHHSAQGWLSE